MSETVKKVRAQNSIQQDQDYANASLMLFLLIIVNKGWLTINHGATASPYVVPNGWDVTSLSGQVTSQGVKIPIYTADNIASILEGLATQGIVNGEITSATSTKNADGTMGPGSMLDTLRAAWGILHWIATHSLDEDGTTLYDPGSTECYTDIRLVTGLHY